MTLTQMTMLTILAAIWGASFLFIRVAVPALGPLLLIDLRVLIAGAALVIYSVASGQLPRLTHKWKQYLLLGCLNAAVPFCLISTAELRLDASVAAILNATTPLFTVIVAYLWTQEPFTMRKLGGVVLGIVGVTVLVGWHSGHTAPPGIGSAILSLGAAVFYGLGGVFASRYLGGETPLDLAIGQQLSAGIVLIPLALFSLPDRLPPPEVVFSVLGLSLMCTAFGYLLYFALIRAVGPVKTLTVTFLVPVFGILLGRLFLQEPIHRSAVVGLVVILISVALATNVAFGKRTKNPARSSK